MKKFIAPLLALLVSGCQIDPYTYAPTLTSTDWYDVGMEDAISGSAIKDDDAFSDSHADRGLYLKGYAEGQKKTCQTDFTYARGLSGKSFPASCNTIKLITHPNKLSMRFYSLCFISHIDDDRMKG